MSLLERISIDRLSPLRLWSALDPDARLLAARSLYAHDWGQAPTKREADLTIATAMRFRDAMVRQLPVDKRAAYLAKIGSPTENLASSLLLALHLEQRRPILAAFLDALGVPHADGLIAEDHELKAPEAPALAKAVAALSKGFDAAEVDLYLATLLALDPDTWGGLAPLLADRSA
ncbi:MAG TPA: hypothetical protein VF139_17820 [Candidatus Polarisedimenticolaceae bacterium]